MPRVFELPNVPDPLEALRRFIDLDGTLLLDSVVRHPHLGRYSFLAADPFRWCRISTPQFGEDPLRPLAEMMRGFPTYCIDRLPPFQGGAAGLMGYELGAAWERLRERPSDAGDFPALAVGLYDCVLAWDHFENRAWIISQGFPAIDPDLRRRRADERLEWMLDRLSGPLRQPRLTTPVYPSEASPCPRSPLANHPGVTSTFSKADYLANVERIIEYIRAGDVFQANLSQQLLAQTTASPIELYARLRTVNPTPFAAYFAAEDWAVMSASPERFLEVRRGEVETRPIKGTRPRSTSPAEDERLRLELAASEKDRAENVMIVDLLRNDLSKVCRPGTIRVPQLCMLESYATVHHLVSTVVGTLEQDKTAWDLLAACFPGGSITGAPKVRAMEILRDLEPTARGPYCGSLFYVGFDGACDSSILIRTMAAKNAKVQIGVGGGITASSNPLEEYDETLIKARGMLAALAEPMREPTMTNPA
ncbi:MAG: aminodeoxychorismate synthase component I [Planctomycetaceae bacterium]